MSSNSQPIKIVIIDDEVEHQRLLKRALGKEGASGGLTWEVHTYTDPTTALAQMPVNGIAVILCDYNLSDSTGLEWIPHLIKAGLGPVIMMSSQGDERVASEAFKAGAVDYLVKMDILKSSDTLRRAIRDAVFRYKLESSNRELSRDLKIANHALQQKNERLRDLTDTAHRFVEDVAHEFRTPLTVIKEFASIMRDGLGGAVTDKQASYLEHIDASAKNLAQMVDDFLDTSKIRARLLRVDRKPHTVADIYQSVRPVLEGRCQSKNIKLETVVGPDLTSPVWCDIEKVGRILINLTSNAIKFSPEGSEVRLWARAIEQGEVEIGVTDHGPGISAEDLEHLGDRLHQTSSGRENSVKGFGLGLNIAKDLIRVSLGKFNVVSEPGKGSTFSFTLPGADTQQLVNRYVEAAVEQDPGVSITILHATPSPGETFDLERARHFLVCHCQSLDIVIPSDDKRSIILLGPTSEPQGWVRSLQSSLSETGAAMRVNDPPIRLDLRWVGTWSNPRLKSAVIASTTNLVEGVRCSA